jgi:fatty-acyl-CoA synthase
VDNERSLTDIIQNNLCNTNKILLIKSEQEEISISYEQLYQKASEFLFQLQDWGIRPGDELIISIEDNELFLYVFWACLLGKIIAVPVNAGTNNENKLKIIKIWLGLCNPHFIANQKVIDNLEKFTIEKNIDITDILKKRAFPVNNIQEMSPRGDVFQASPDDIAFIQFSSGSTGDPKGVTLTHKNLVANITAIIKAAQITLEDSSLSWLPLTHDMGLIGFHLGSLALGINQYIMPAGLFIRYPMLWLSKASQHKATILSSPNFGYKYFLSFFKTNITRDWNLSQVRLIFNGAEPISSQLCNDFLSEMGKYGLKKNVMFPVYGLAEASLAVTFPPPEEELVSVHLNRSSLKIGAQAEEVEEEGNSSITFVDVGYPVDDCLVKICNTDNHLLDNGVIGQIHIKGTNVTSGYYNNMNASAQVISSDGWLNTGDLGFIRNGRLVITGRAKDVIFVNGQNYYPHDIERIAAEVDGVELGEVAAFGVPNAEQQNEDIILVVQYKKEIEKFLLLSLALKKYINQQIGLEVREIIPAKKIPKTTSGKLMRFKLKEMYQNGDFSIVLQEIDKLTDEYFKSKNLNQSKNIIEDQLLKLLIGLIKDEDVSIYDNFLEMSCNSLILTSFCAQIETENIAKISVMDLFSYPSIQKLAEFISMGVEKSRNSISYLQLKLPVNYFNKEDSFGKPNEGSVFFFKLPYDLVNDLKTVSHIEKISIEEILLVLFVYQLAEIAEHKEVAVQTILNKQNQVAMVIVNFDGIQEIGELFQLIHSKFQDSNAYTYSLNNIRKINLRKDPFSIIPFFYKESLILGEFDFLHVYDISCGILETNNMIELFFEFNTERLNREKIEEYIRAYIQLIYAVDTTYQTKIKEIAG